MKNQLFNPNNTIEQNLSSIREKLTTLALLLLNIALLPLILLSYYQTLDTGWKPFMTVKIVSYLVLLAILIFQKIIPYKLKAGILIITLFMIGCHLLFSWGISSGSGLYFIFATIMAAILFEKYISIIVVIASSMILSLAAFLKTSHGIIAVTHTTPINQNLYLSSWISYIALYIAGSLILIISLKLIYYIMSKNIQILIEKNIDITETNNKLKETIESKEILEAELEKQLVIIEKNLQCMFKTISKIIEEKDTFIIGHQDKVAMISVAIADKLNMDKDSVNAIELAAKIHDVGKIFLPQDILNKEEVLTEAEYALVKTHVEKGYRILHEASFPSDILTAIRQHHERIDGSGYPFGLKGEYISVEAKILAVADVIDAMLSVRSHRKPFAGEEIIHELRTNSGILFDSKVVKASVELLSDRTFLKNYKKLHNTLQQ